MLALQTGGVQVPIWPRAAVHDTVAAIVKQAAYRRELSTTLLDRATVGLLATSGLIRRHDSKTSGDYARELRRGGAPAYAGFRRFGSLYDRIIYGDGVCNGSEYTALLEAAQSVTVRGGERAA